MKTYYKYEGIVNHSEGEGILKGKLTENVLKDILQNTQAVQSRNKTSYLIQEDISDKSSKGLLLWPHYNKGNGIHLQIPR